MIARRCVCSWCLTELPDDWYEWAHHHFAIHGVLGHSVRFYPLLSVEQELATLVEGHDRG